LACGASIRSCGTGEHGVPAFNHWRHESNVASFASIGVWSTEKCDSVGAKWMRGRKEWRFVSCNNGGRLYLLNAQVETKVSVFWISPFAPRPLTS
jgi:hypothetical protein